MSRKERAGSMLSDVEWVIDKDKKVVFYKDNDQNLGIFLTFEHVEQLSREIGNDAKTKHGSKRKNIGNGTDKA